MAVTLGSVEAGAAQDRASASDAPRRSRVSSAPAGAGVADMPRVDAVWRHPGYRYAFASLQQAEANRIFCRHDLQHFLDVARACWILLLEDESARDLHIPKDIVYAAALLHDIGRGAEYETGEPHDAAGARIAREILGTVEPDTRFSPGECAQIVCAIAHHRSSAAVPDAAADRAVVLSRALRRADKAVRPCFACPARSACNWPDEKKNLAIRM